MSSFSFIFNPSRLRGKEKGDEAKGVTVVEGRRDEVLKGMALEYQKAFRFILLQCS